MAGVLGWVYSALNDGYEPAFCATPAATRNDATLDKMRSITARAGLHIFVWPDICRPYTSSLSRHGGVVTAPPAWWRASVHASPGGSASTRGAHESSYRSGTHFPNVQTTPVPQSMRRRAARAIALARRPRARPGGNELASLFSRGGRNQRLLSPHCSIYAVRSPPRLPPRTV